MAQRQRQEQEVDVQLRILIVASLAVAMAACGGSGSGNNNPGPPAPPPTQDVRDPSVGRQWNDVMLDAIRNDFARPTVHARNLWHTSAAVYDAWAVYDDTSATYLLGNQVGGFDCPLAAFNAPADVHLAREEAISHRCLSTHRTPFRRIARGRRDDGGSRRADAKASVSTQQMRPRTMPAAPRPRSAITSPTATSSSDCRTGPMKRTTT